MNIPQDNHSQQSTDTISFIPLGGVGDVTKNMYLYEYQNQILIVDCGLGFADETMLGVDLLLPDISYLLKVINQGKKIIGMVVTHGHEDHIGALPFILPQLPPFPLYGSPLTAALANEKLKEFSTGRNVQTITFDNPEIRIGDFTVTFIRVTHSVPDTANLFIKTPVGNFYHGSDFKFDLTPYDGKKTDFQKIAAVGKQGVLSLMSDALGSERQGVTLSEKNISVHFKDAMNACKGKVIITTYSSNISRLNQAIKAAQSAQRKVCFIGRSLIKAKEVAQKMGYVQIETGQEIEIQQLRDYGDHQVLLLVAGSQGQENSAMTRIAAGEHRDIKLAPGDIVIFSSDPIPGNEVLVNAVVDSIAKSGATVLYSALSHGFHVSGHGSQDDLMLMMNLVNAKNVLPIGATYRHMIAYQQLAKSQGYKADHILLLEDGQEMLFSATGEARYGKKISVRNVYVDEITGEEVESFVLRDRQKISLEGVVIVMVEIDSATGAIVGKPDIIVRGLSSKDVQDFRQTVMQELKKAFPAKGKIDNWIFIRKKVGEVTENRVFKILRRRPLVLPVIIEV